jgi:hypothetical protein
MKAFTTDDIVELRNIDNEDFEFSVYGVPGYLIPAGQTEKMPGYMAQLCMKHMCDQVMQKRDMVQLMNNKVARDEIYEEIFVGVEPTIKPMPRNDAERARAEFEAARAGNGPAQQSGAQTVVTAGVEESIANELIDKLDADNNEKSAFVDMDQ